MPALVILLAGVILVNGTSLELITAAKIGLFQIVTNLIDAGVDVNGVDAWGYSALMYAAEKGHLGIVTTLVQAGANVDRQGIEVGHTALNLATISRHTQIVRSLLEAGADPDLTTHSGYTPLHIAAARDADIVNLLIDHGANVHIFDNEGHSALTEAARNGLEDIVESLLEKGVDVNALSPNGGRDYSPLMCASEGGHARIVEILLARGALVNHVSHNVGIYFLPNIERVIIKWQLTLNEAYNLLETNPELRDLRYTAILVASERGHTHIVRLLASHGADTNAQQFDGFTAMHYAANQGNSELVSFLIEKKAKIDVVNEEGKTPLVLAVDRGRFETANLLMAHGADINIKTNLGNTPLSVAALLGYDSLVRNLIYAGADIPDIIAQDRHAEFIQPLLKPIQQLAGAAEINTLAPREVITASFIRMKAADNDALPPKIIGGSDPRSNMVSRILKFLVILRIKDASIFYLVAPFLAEADIEQLDRFGSVLAFLTAPMRKQATILEIGKNELVPFIEKTFNQLITRSVVLGFPTIVTRMHAAFVQVDAHFKAVSHGMRVIPEVHLGTVFQYRHGEFGIYSKFADLVATDIN